MAGIHDLLNWIDNGRRTVGRNLSDLINSPKDYLEGVVNELPNTVRDYASDPMNFVGGKMGGVAQTAWHGSPHKFSKFSLDKIGTGEGAQAYGHGLYLAENPKVAQEYSALNPTGSVTPNRIFNGVELTPGSPEYHAGTLLERSTLPATRKEVARWIAEGHPDQSVVDGWKKTLDTLNSATKKSDFKVGKNENLYKTDIPDEAVARFLDWDKPLSQDSPQAFKDAFNKLHETYPALKEQFFQAFRDKRPGNHYYSLLNDYAKTGDLVKNQTFATDAMREAGIPGIRYLDGGSRPTGQVDKQLLSMLDKHGGDPVAAVDDFMRFVHNTPAKKASMRDQFLKELQQNRTSNFVAFDPEMIRILERNGQATGLEPWKPGEYRLKDLIGKE